MGKYARIIEKSIVKLSLLIAAFNDVILDSMMFKYYIYSWNQ